MLHIDAHTHAYPEIDRERVLERVRLLDGHLASDNPYKWQLYQEGTIEALVETETRAGFDRWVLLPIAGRPDGCSRLNRWAADQAKDYPQIIPFVLEILPPEEIEKLIQRKGSDFVLFGSDNPWRRPEESWDRFLRLDLSSSDRVKIAGLNLQRILGPGPLE